MKFPNKLYTFNESIFNNFTIILTVLKKNNDIKILELFELTRNKFLNISEFLETLEALYLLKKIEYNYITRRIIYVN